jgi:sterol 24-C-methyltransferase
VSAAESSAFGALSASSTKAKRGDWRRLTSLYYDVSTPFYTQMWGQALHFAPRWLGESWPESMRRHEQYLALRLGLTAGARVLDAGCGVGGPARTIARFSGAAVTGANINALQVALGTELNAAVGVPAAGAGSVRLVEADFTRLPHADGAFDAVYAIEATCHAPDRNEVFRELFRVLKPGGKFACYEWVMTKKFDARNAAHAEARLNIEAGNGIAELGDARAVTDALRRAGFVVDECADLATTSQEEWYLPSKGEFPWTLQSWKSSSIGFVVLFLALWFQHLVGLVDHTVFKGLKTITRGPLGLVRAAELDIFTPMLFVLCTKPADGAKPAAAAGRAASPAPAARGRKASPAPSKRS